MIRSSEVIVVLISLLLCCIYGSKVDFEPYSLIQQERIVGFFTLDKQNLSNIAPDYEVNSNGYFFEMVLDIILMFALDFLVLLSIMGANLRQ